MSYKAVKSDCNKPERRTFATRAKKKLFQHVNALNWLPNYTKIDAVGDVIAGITVGLTLMPQSIAYASLAGLSAQYGLYSAFIGGYIYMIFGTIKEVSIGPTAVMSLLTYEFTQGLGIEYIVLLTFLTGCIELLMGFLNLGFLLDFISSPVTSGFTSAYSIIIIASQLKSILGLRKFKTKGFVDNINKLLAHVHETRLWDTLLGTACIIFLLTLRKFKDIPVGKPEEMKLTNRQKKIKKALWFVSISRNAITVLLCGLFAYLLESSGSSPFILSGTVKPGLPSFNFPSFSIQEGNSTITFPEMCSELGIGILVIPVVGVLANIAIAKAFSSGAPIDASQEMITLGICNLVGSCVCSLPTCGAFTRSAVSDASGVRTPMMGIYSASLIVLALNILTPYFYFIPRATLAAILISAVFFMIDWEIVKPLWKSSKKDLILVAVTFVSCLSFGVETGLLIGVVTNIGFLLYLWARPAINIVLCKTSVGGEYVLVTPDFGLMYPGTDHLSNAVCKAGVTANNTYLPVAINCTCIKTMDYSAVKALNVINKTFQKRRELLIIYKLRPEIKSMIENAGIKMSYCETEEDIVEALYGEKLDLARSDTLPLLEKGLKEHKVTIERENKDYQEINESIQSETNVKV